MKLNVCFAIIIVSSVISTEGSVTEPQKNTTSTANATSLANMGNANAVQAVPATQVVTTAPTIIANPTTTRRPLLQGLRMPCSCKDGQCGCCTGMILDQFKQKACMNITYNPDDFEVTAQMTMNQRVLYKNSFSGKNPPPMCIRVPRFRFIEFCVEFSNIYFAKRNIHLCIDAEASWDDFTLMEWSFDCLRLGASGVAVIGPEDGGGIALSSIDAEDQTDEDYDDNARNVPLTKVYESIHRTVDIYTKNSTDNIPITVQIVASGTDVTMSFDNKLANNLEYDRKYKSN